MKNFSTVGLFFSCAVAVAGLAAPAAQGQQLASETVSASRLAGVRAACPFRADAPDQHRVVRGDTLWGIAGMFLPQPWCWPEVWDLNRDQIANPHWIYPGQIVYFDRAAGRLRLGNVVAANDGAEMRLAPQVRTEALDADAVPTISSAAIEPFLTQALVIEGDELADTPRVVAIQEGRVYLSRNDTAYVRGDLKAGTLFQLFRPGKALVDPVTGKTIANEATYLGAARLQHAGSGAGEVHSFTIVAAAQEIGVGDRLLAMPARPILNYAPHRPAQSVDAAIMSVYGGVAYAGQNQVVAVNRGQQDGLDVGSVLNLYRKGAQIVDKTAAKGWLGGGEKIKLPDEEIGNLFIFRTFKHVSYGLIMQVSDAVHVGDGAKSPP